MSENAEHLPAAVKAFDVNGKPPEGRRGAMLPMLGMHKAAPFAAHHLPRDVDQYLATLHQQIGDIQKSVMGSLDTAAKALSVDVPQAFSYSTMAFMPDPANYGLMQWPGINPETLKKITMENVAARMVIQAREGDLARYSEHSTHAWKPGWRITLRESLEVPGTKDKADIREAESYIQNCSRDVTDARQRDAQQIMPFEYFLRSFADDAHTFDGWAIWTAMDSQRRIKAFRNLPAGQIRLSVPGRGYKGQTKYFAALVDETGNPVRPFTRDELTWRVRNVRLDPAIGGYGYSEVEMAVKLIAAFQSAVDLNATTFTQNSIPNGMLLLKGDYFQQEQIDALMREWTNMKRGLSKLWGLPVMAVPEDGDVSVIDFMDMKGQEVRYRDHMNMMMGLLMFMYQFPIRRLGMFVSGQHRDNAPSTDAAIEIQGADDPGLPPLLIHIENTINEYLLWPNWPKLEFMFMNKNPKEDARSFQERTKARTWKEARAEVDLPSLSTLAPKHLKPLAEILELAPEDPNKASAFQTIAVKMLEAQLGEIGGEGGDSPNPGNPTISQKDPAASQGHGTLGGIRRNSRREKDRAATKVPSTST